MWMMNRKEFSTVWPPPHWGPGANCPSCPPPPSAALALVLYAFCIYYLVWWWTVQFYGNTAEIPAHGQAVNTRPFLSSHAAWAASPQRVLNLAEQLHGCIYDHSVCRYRSCVEMFSDFPIWLTLGRCPVNRSRCNPSIDLSGCKLWH